MGIWHPAELPREREERLAEAARAAARAAEAVRAAEQYAADRMRWLQLQEQREQEDRAAFKREYGDELRRALAPAVPAR